MNRRQQQDFLLKWSLFDDNQQRNIMREYIDLIDRDFSQNSFLAFLREKLEREDNGENPAWLSEDRL